MTTNSSAAPEQAPLADVPPRATDARQKLHTRLVSGPVSRLVATQKHQAREFLADVLRMRGLMPLLMKNRNGGSWTIAEKAELLAQLRILSRISPYLLFLLLPGSALLLPVYAWWLDHRRRPRASAMSAPPSACPDARHRGDD